MTNLYDIFIFIAIALSGISLAKYMVYMFSTPFYLFKKLSYLEGTKKLTKKQIEAKTKVSVIVPAWNEEAGIIASVESILRSSYKNLEVVVVNDGSTDSSDAKMKAFMRSPKGRKFAKNGQLKYFYQQNTGKGGALNRGIKNSTGDIIITCDADTVFDKDAVYHMARYFAGNKVDAAVGNVKIANGKNLLGLVQQIEYMSGFYFKRTHSVFGSEYIIGGAFGVFRRYLFDLYGYFDEVNKTEDIEYSTRLQYHGVKIAYVEDAIAYTEGPTTLGGLFKQRLRWKKGRFDTLAKYSDLFFSSDKKHRKFLTHFLLPISMFYELQLLFEPILTTFAFYHFFKTSNYFAFVGWVLISMSIIFIIYFFGSKDNSRRILLMAPVYVIFYFAVTAAEIYAIFASLKLFIKRQNVTWQTWNRKGVAANA